MQSRKKLVIPFIPSFPYKLQRIAKEMKVKTVSKKNRTLKNRLTTVKGHQAPNNCIYQQPCGTCGKVYIGETGRFLTTRIKEHQSALKNNPDGSAIATHILNNNHTLDWSECQILEKETNTIKRKIKEAINIRKNNNNINRIESSFPLNKVWTFEFLNKI